VKRILSALAAVASVAALALGAAGTANAETVERPQELVIAEAALGPTVPQQFIKIESTQLEPVTLENDLYVTATFAGQPTPVVVATIPAGITFTPGKWYTISDIKRPVRCADLTASFPVFTGQASFTLTNVTIPRIVDRGNIPLSTRPNQSLHRESLAAATFTMGARTPCSYSPLPLPSAS
jgi:hypothetical protein